MLDQVQEQQELIERVAALDIGKAALTCCVRVPGKGAAGRAQEVTEYPDDEPVVAADGRPAARARRDASKGNGSTGHGNAYLARVLGEAAVGASRTNTVLGARYRRIARRVARRRRSWPWGGRS